jgi:hypothetical protein
MFSNVRPYEGAHINDDDMSSEGSPGPSSSKRRKTSKSNDRNGGGKGKDVLEFDPTTKYITCIAKSDSDETFDLVPSAKTAALKAILLKGFEDAPLDKVRISDP